MATLNPTEESIKEVIDIIQCDRREAILRLKENNNNPTNVINEYFDGGQKAGKYSTWDETQFNGDRDGGNTHHGISFDIHAQDDHGPNQESHLGFGSQSRPPSRTDNKSPIGKVIDLTAEHTAASPNMSYNPGMNLPPDDLDEDTRKAIALSLLPPESYPPQETGVTNISGDNPSFGPATRQAYESGNWGMVPFGPGNKSHRWLADPEPADRKRQPGQPAFLKPSWGNHRLGAFLTIYHAIPLVRNIFLNYSDFATAYGEHIKDWWSGTPVVLPLNIDPREKEMDRELQRLMAFLDATERSYGSIEALAQHPEVQKVSTSSGGDELAIAVMAAWRNHIAELNPQNAGMIKKIFSTGVSNEAAAKSSDKDDKTQFAILELFLPPKGGPGSEFNTLYDICDDLLWPDLQLLDDCPFLKHVADVVTFKIAGGEHTKPVDVPLVWYPDRYLKENKEVAFQMRREKFEVRERLQMLDNIKIGLTDTAPRLGNKEVKLADLFASSTRHDEAQLTEEEDAELDAELDLGEEFQGLRLPRQRSIAAANLTAELASVTASIDRKLMALEEERNSLFAEMRSLSTLLTSPSRPPNPVRPYTLRGVSTTKNTFYLCKLDPLSPEQQEDPDLITFEAPTETWWRIHYDTTISITKVTPEEVREAAKTESKEILAVYASTAAMNATPVVPPRKLSVFVTRDNRNFQNELQGNGDVEMGDYSNSYSHSQPQSHVRMEDVNPGNLPSDKGYEQLPSDDTDINPSSPGKRKRQISENGDGDGDAVQNERLAGDLGAGSRSESESSESSAVSEATITGNAPTTPSVPKPARAKTRGEELFGAVLPVQEVEEKVRGRGREVFAGRGSGSEEGKEMSERRGNGSVLVGVGRDQQKSKSKSFGDVGVAGELRSELDAMDLDLDEGDGGGSGGRGGDGSGKGGKRVGFVE